MADPGLCLDEDLDDLVRLSLNLCSLIQGQTELCAVLIVPCHEVGSIASGLHIILSWHMYHTQIFFPSLFLHIRYSVNEIIYPELSLYIDNRSPGSVLST